MKIGNLFLVLSQVSAWNPNKDKYMFDTLDSSPELLHRSVRDLYGWNRMGNTVYMSERAGNIPETPSRAYLSHVLKRDISAEEAKRFARYMRRQQIRRRSKSPQWW